MSPILRRSVQLVGEQIAAVESLLAFPKRVQTLGGYAGTGKTTLIRELMRHLPNFSACAFTGKAASVLRKKGVPATTIHSLIYEPHEEEYVDQKGRHRTRVAFSRKERVDWAGFIVDEASMVGRLIYADLVAFGLPIIFVGDHGQLEPVQGGDFNLMACPDITLEQIHRNAGEIAHFAEFIRQGNTPANWRRHRRYTGESVRFLTLQDLTDCHAPNMADADDPQQIIVAYNKTRVGLNQDLRRHLGYPADRPVKGDRVICLQNDHQAGLFNGMMGIVAAVAADEMVFRADGEDYRVRYIPEQFNSPQAPDARDRKSRLPFDYAYCLTCHKSQGDEWNSVLVLEQRCGAWDHTRWAYTAASRARKHLEWVTL